MKKIMHKQEGFTLVELLMAMVFFSFILIFASASYIQINRSYVRGANVKLVQEQTRKVLAEISNSLRESGSGVVTINDNDDNIVTCATGKGISLNSNPDKDLSDYAKECRHRLCIGDKRYAWNQVVRVPNDSEHSWFYFPGAGDIPAGFHPYRPDGITLVPFGVVETSGGNGDCLSSVELLKSTELIDGNRIMVQDIDIEEIIVNGKVVPDTWKITVSLSTIDTTPGDDQDLLYDTYDGEYKALGCHLDSGSQQFCYVETLSTIVTVR